MALCLRGLCGAAVCVCVSVVLQGCGRDGGNGGNGPSPSPAPEFCPGALYKTHYGPPPCAYDEDAWNVGSGRVCVRSCGEGETCPTDVPAGTRSVPGCIMESFLLEKGCGIPCNSDRDCGGGAVCELGYGVCAYPPASAHPEPAATSVEWQGQKCGGTDSALGARPGLQRVPLTKKTPQTGEALAAVKAASSALLARYVPGHPLLEAGRGNISMYYQMMGPVALGTPPQTF